jgi:formylglycine-generating enzyme required for sulfatase activity
VLNETSTETQWWFAEGTSDPAVIENFVKRFPRSDLLEQAQGRVKDLRRQQAALATGIWGYVQGANDPKELEKFAAQYPASPEAKEALARLEALKQRVQLAVKEAEAKAIEDRALPVSADGSTCMLASLSSRSAQRLSKSEECALTPKSAFKECDKCPEMIVVPAGSFKMGSPGAEQERDPSECPQHPVTLLRDFAVGRFVVTFPEWDACAAEGGCKGYRPSDQGWGRGAQPVINVSWNDAKAYVEWLTKKTSKPYRLLTEAEWEYVTRAGTATPFWWGETITPSQANYNSSNSYAGGKTGDYRAKALAVNWFDPNPFGLYQVHGNVLEWVEDCVHDSYEGAPVDGSAWKSAECSNRMMRGGAFSSDPASVRSAARYPTRADARSPQKGFRIARTL